MVTFDWGIEAEILIFQLVNFDYFVVKNDHCSVTFNYWISHLQLTFYTNKLTAYFLVKKWLFKQW